jgi:hypothetical protein
MTTACGLFRPQDSVASVSVWDTPPSTPATAWPPSLPETSPRFVLRTFGSLLAVAGWFGAVAFWFRLGGAGGGEYGGFWAPLAYFPAAVAAFLVWWGRRERWLIAGLVVLLAIGAGTISAHRAPVTTSTLNQALDRVVLPAGTTVLGHETHNSCFSSCAQVTRWYGVPGAPEHARDLLGAALQRAGFSRQPDAPGHVQVWTRGRVAVSFRAGGDDLGLPVVKLAPAGDAVLLVDASAHS